MLQGDAINAMRWLDANHGWIAGYHNGLGDIWRYDASLGVSSPTITEAAPIAYPNPVSSTLRLNPAGMRVNRSRLIDEIGRTAIDQNGFSSDARNSSMFHD